MSFYDKLVKIKSIKNRLIDDESKAIFDAKIDYMITRKEDTFIEAIWSFLNKMYCPDLASVMNSDNEKRRIVIFGCGHDGLRTKKVLEICGYKAECFCDSDIKKKGKIVDGLEVISQDELVSNYKEDLVILSSRLYKRSMYEQLIQLNFPEKNIVFPNHPIILGTSNVQYFDVFDYEKNEVFLDVGAYNGDTTKQFISWTGGEYEKIYVLEPIEEQFKYIEKKRHSEDWKNIVLYQKAAWNCSKKLNFYDNEMGSMVVEENTGQIVEGEAIDKMVGNERVTFIKMDVEGSELLALEGAKKTIQRDRPKLAISIYHKYEDIIEIPLKILELVPEYNFYLRHYTTDIWETVLYAVCNH